MEKDKVVLIETMKKKWGKHKKIFTTIWSTDWYNIGKTQDIVNISQR